MHCADKSRQILSILIAVAALLSPIMLHAQAAPRLPSGWQQLPAQELAVVIRNLKETGDFSFLPIPEQEELKAGAKERFLQIDLANTDLSYQTLEMLHWLARGDFERSTVERNSTALIARQDDWTDKPYAELRAKVAIMNRLKAPEVVLAREIRRWVQAGGKFEDVPASDLKFAIVRQMFSDSRLINSSFKVRWDGLITPRQSGAYQFLISPINVNAGQSPQPGEFEMSITVGGQQVLNTSPDKSKSASNWQDPLAWVTQSNVIQLTADQPVNIQVSASVSGPKGIPTGRMHAILLWKGPNDRIGSIVPADNLSLPDGSGGGLLATYTWSEMEQSQSFTRVERIVDVAWTNRTLVLMKDTQLADRGADTLWQTVTATPYIAAISGPPLKTHPFLDQPNDSAAALTTARRSAFLDILLKNPSLLDPMDSKAAVRFFEPFRAGAPDKALEVFGTWAIRHPDVIPDFSTDKVFNGDQRFAFARMAILTTQQLPQQAAALQNLYLELPDGRCALPTAYTLACSHIGRKTFADWVALLDAKLADTTIAGDRRVNWLLARANAEELDPNSSSHYPDYYPVPFFDPLKSQSYLSQALRAAQSPEVKVRVAREIIARLTWHEDFDQAKSTLSSLGQSLPIDEQSLVASLNQNLDSFISAKQQADKALPAIAREAHLKQLRLRREEAAKQGDDANRSRYDALINVIENKR